MIPLNTTLIRVLRIPADSGEPPGRDPYEEQPAREAVHENVRANISSPFGRERNAGGSQEVVEFSMSCDPVDLLHTDQVQDQTTGELYDVVWARQRVGFGLEHTRAGLKQVAGVVS